VTLVPIAGLVDGRLDPRDRGLAYGDGLFETMRWSGGRVPLLARHLARLADGARRLGIALPDLASFEAAVSAVAPANADAMVKLVVTRGVGPRGYASPKDPSPTAFALVETWAPRAIADPEGLSLVWCRVRLAAQPALAGIKHLNRLEQVLARAEWDDPTIDEGLLCDPSGHVVCATAANLFAVIDGRLVTPDVSHAGVAGVARGVLLDEPALAPVVRQIPREALDAAEELFLTNALAGVRPVVRLGECRWRAGEAAREAARVLARHGLESEAVR
jgi:4-amino-4-deoxychorismate lyase